MVQPLVVFLASPFPVALYIHVFIGLSVVFQNDAHENIDDFADVLSLLIEIQFCV